MHTTAVLYTGLQCSGGLLVNLHAIVLCVVNEIV